MHQDPEYFKSNMALVGIPFNYLQGLLLKLVCLTYWFDYIRPDPDIIGIPISIWPTFLGPVSYRTIGPIFLFKLISDGMKLSSLAAVN